MPLPPNFRLARTSLWDANRDFVCFVEGSASAKHMGAAWFVENRAQIRQALEDFGVVFFRGFAPNIANYEHILNAIAPGKVSIQGSVSPRRNIQGSVYAATDIPNDVGIVQHHEMAYHSFTPHFISFYCDEAPDEGGVTTLCDSRHIAKIVDQRVIAELEQKGALYVRNFAEEKPSPLMTWQQSYGTEDVAEVERVLQHNGVRSEWLSPTWLRTTQRRPAVLVDRATGDRVLFGCVLLWSKAYFGALASHFNFEFPNEPWEQWYASFYGDGSEISEDFIAELQARYNEEAVHIPWQKNDFMIVNNLVASHGRTPSAGKRNILATLREPQMVADLRTGGTGAAA